LNSLLDKAVKEYYVTQVLKHCIDIKTMCPNYKRTFRNTNSHVW